MRHSKPLLQGVSLLVLVLLVLSTAGLSQAQEPAGEASLCFRRGDGGYCSRRPMNLGGDLPDQLQRVLQALVAGPATEELAAGVWSAIPQGADLAEVTVEGARVSIYLVLPYLQLSEEEVQAIVYHDGQYVKDNASVAKE